MQGRSLWTPPTLLILATLAVTPIVADQTPTGQQGTLFRVETNFVRTDVIVRDREGRFVPDMRADEFRVYEDGVLQNVTLFTPWVGGRALGNLASVTGAGPARPSPEGLMLPAARQQQDASGRLFIVFIDDLHLRATETPRVREVLRMIRDLLIHDNDLVGFVSTGTSSIQIDPAYDFGHRRFNEAINKVMGSAPSPDEIIQDAVFESSQGPRELRHAAHVAFQTAYELLDQMASITERRKAFVYVSGGYHFNPYRESRLQRIQDYYAMWAGTAGEDTGDGSDDDSGNDLDSFLENDYHRRTVFSEADLISEVAQLTRAAQRSNVTFYTVDPRGLVATGGDASIRTQISHTDLRDFTATQVSTLRVLAEETGGFAIVETNDFERGIRRIDSETSDFYQLGYVSSNPDPTRVRRIIRIELTRNGLQDPIYRSEYTLPRSRRR